MVKVNRSKITENTNKILNHTYNLSNFGKHVVQSINFVDFCNFPCSLQITKPKCLVFISSSQCHKKMNWNSKIRIHQIKLKHSKCWKFYYQIKIPLKQKSNKIILLHSACLIREEQEKQKKERKIHFDFEKFSLRNKVLLENFLLITGVVWRFKKNLPVLIQFITKFMFI